MKLGKHVSIAGGLDKAPERAQKIGCNSLQIFAKNPRGWQGRDINPAEHNKLNNVMEEKEMGPLVVHSIYLINLATPKEKLWQKSLAALQDDYYRSGLMGADYLVFHPGSHTGQGIEKGITAIARGVNEILNKIDNECIILLENIAGAGTGIGSNFKELHDIIKLVEDKNRVGICLDTCHAFAAGYDLSRKEGIDRMLHELEHVLGLNYLKVIHTNDSKHPLGSKKDEHAHIGEGYIGEKGFEELINHPQLKDLPFILETPAFDGKDLDVIRLKQLRK